MDEHHNTRKFPFVIHIVICRLFGNVRIIIMESFEIEIWGIKHLEKLLAKKQDGFFQN